MTRTNDAMMRSLLVAPSNGKRFKRVISKCLMTETKIQLNTQTRAEKKIHPINVCSCVPIYEKPIDIDPIHFIKPVNQRRQRLVVAGSSSTQMAHCGRIESKAFSIRVLIYGCHCILAHSHAPTCIIAPLRNWNGIAIGKLSWCTKYNREWMARGNWLHMLSQLILPFVRSFVRQQDQEQHHQPVSQSNSRISGCESILENHFLHHCVPK